MAREDSPICPFPQQCGAPGEPASWSGVLPAAAFLREAPNGLHSRADGARRKRLALRGCQTAAGCTPLHDAPRAIRAPRPCLAEPTSTPNPHGARLLTPGPCKQAPTDTAGHDGRTYGAPPTRQIAGLFAFRSGRLPLAWNRIPMVSPVSRLPRHTESREAVPPRSVSHPGSHASP